MPTAPAQAARPRQGGRSAVAPIRPLLPLPWWLLRGRSSSSPSSSFSDLVRMILLSASSLLSVCFSSRALLIRTCVATAIVLLLL